MISFVDGYFGYLGNQMFQYAATKALSIHLTLKNSSQPVGCRFPKAVELNTIFCLSAQEPLPYALTQYREPHYRYDPAFWHLSDHTQLYGYFQSEKYFAPYAEQIRKEFRFRSEPGGCRSIASEGGVVSIHVRRGDYLSFPDHHPPLGINYYHEAMSRFPGARFFVLSDDPGWCLLNFRDAGYEVEISTGRSPADDLALMAACDHHIIANSSFSWWGAWLGRNPLKRVIAPLKWFGPAKPLPQWDTSDLIPEGWERI